MDRPGAVVSEGGPGSRMFVAAVDCPCYFSPASSALEEAPRWYVRRGRLCHRDLASIGQGNDSSSFLTFILSSSNADALRLFLLPLLAPVLVPSIPISISTAEESYDTMHSDMKTDPAKRREGGAHVAGARGDGGSGCRRLFIQHHVRPCMHIKSTPHALFLSRNGETWSGRVGSGRVRSMATIVGTGEGWNGELSRGAGRLRARLLSSDSTRAKPSPILSC